nr:transposase [Vagococcus elongatus]
MKLEVTLYMKTSIKTLKKHLNRIENAFNYPFSNGTLEGLNNKIKVIKRTAHGYRSFWHFKHRILVSFKLINQKDTPACLSKVV